MPLYISLSNHWRGEPNSTPKFAFWLSLIDLHSFSSIRQFVFNHRFDCKRIPRSFHHISVLGHFIHGLHQWLRFISGSWWCGEGLGSFLRRSCGCFLWQSQVPRARTGTPGGTVLCTSCTSDDEEIMISALIITLQVCPYESIWYVWLCVQGIR